MKEGSTPNQGFDISPSNREQKERGSLFATKFPHEVVERTMRMVRKHPLAVAEALLAIAGGAYGATQGISLLNGEDNSIPPPATRDINSVPRTSFSDDDSMPEIKGLPSHLEQHGSTNNKDGVFDNGAEKIEISKKNIYFLTPENIGQFNLRPVIDKDAGTITGLLPFKIAENTTGTIERMTVEKLDPYILDKNYVPTVIPIDFKFNKIVTIVAPEDSHMYLIRGIQDWGQDPNLAGQVWYFKYYEEENTTVVWRFTDNNPTKLGSFNNLLQIQNFEKGKLRGTNYESLPVVDALTEVMTTTEPNQPVRLSVMAYKGKIAGPDASVVGDDFLLKPHFFTESSNAAEKLLAFKK